MPSSVSIPRAGLVLVSVLWLGVLLGVSFLATPVKFQAQSLSLAVALDVGQVTFALLSNVEWALAVGTAGCLIASRPRYSDSLIFVAVVAIVAAQTFWFLPVLDVRLEAVIAGTPPSPSSHHMFYVAAEGAKALLLAGLALLALRRLLKEQPNVRAGRPGRVAQAEKAAARPPATRN
jgi:hypothetical protein